VGNYSREKFKERGTRYNSAQGGKNLKASSVAQKGKQFERGKGKSGGEKAAMGCP